MHSDFGGNLEVFYANAFSIMESENLFLVFETIIAENSQKVCIVVSPSGAKTLLNMLQEAITKLEKQNGQIKPWELPIQNGLTPASGAYIH